MDLVQITANALSNKIYLYEDIKRNGPIVIAHTLEEIISLFNNSYKIFDKEHIKYSYNSKFSSDNSCYRITKSIYKNDNSQLPYKGFFIQKVNTNDEEKYIGTTHYFNVKDDIAFDYKQNMDTLVINRDNFICYIGDLYTKDDMYDKNK